jgi:hypothetical protein
MLMSGKHVDLHLSNHLTHWHRLTKAQQVELLEFVVTKAHVASCGQRIEQLRLEGSYEDGAFRRRQIDEWLDALPERVLTVVDVRCRHLYMSRLHALQRSCPLRQTSTGAT